MEFNSALETSYEQEWDADMPLKLSRGSLTLERSRLQKDNLRETGFISDWKWGPSALVLERWTVFI